MHARKRAVSASDDANVPDTKRSITARTVEKWKTENDKTLGTATWLTYNMAYGRSRSREEHALFGVLPVQRSTARHAELQAGVHRGLY